MDASVAQLGSQITLGLLGSALLQWAKKREWLPFINQHSAAINHGILVVTSLLSAISVHMTWDPVGTVTITGLTLTGISHGAWNWAKQWAYQFIVQKNVFGNVATPAPMANPLLQPGGQAAVKV